MVWETIIVTRHKGAVRWLREKYSWLIKGAKVVTHINPDTIPSKTNVIGILPITIVKRLLDKGCTVTIIQLPNIPEEFRGKELTPEEMERYGARLFYIEELEWRELPKNKTG